jgi:hypothetical protein
VWLWLALAGPTLWFGGWLGTQGGQLILAPTRRSVLIWAVAVVLVLPAITGSIDLYLRHATP